MSEVNDNPFFKLFGNSENTIPERDEDVSCIEISERSPCNSEKELVTEKAISWIAEDVFGIALSQPNLSLMNGRVGVLVYLEEYAPMLCCPDMNSLKIVAFERLCLTDIPESMLLRSAVHKSRSLQSELHVKQTNCIPYLFECFRRTQYFIHSNSPDHPNDLLEMVSVFVVENFSLALKQPQLFEGQNVHRQVVNLFDSEDEMHLTHVIKEVVQLILGEDDKRVLFEAFAPILSELQTDFSKCMVMNFPRQHFVLLNTFAGIPALAELIVDYNKPKVTGRGIAYADTLFGAILNLSCLPKSVEGPMEYFERPLDGALNALDNNLWVAMGELCEKFYVLLDQILRSSTSVRKKMLHWIGSCLDSNLPRGRLWVFTSIGIPGAIGYISDGFSVNLASVLLRLCQPFVNDQKKLLKIDPTFAAVQIGSRNSEEMDARGVHSLSFQNETCLQPLNPDEPRPVSSTPFSFITECFYLTHRALDFSLRVLLERTQTLYQEIGRLQRTLNDARTQGRESVIESFRESMEMEMTRYLCMRCALLEPEMVRMLGDFQVATSIWLVQVVLDSCSEERNSYAPLKNRELVFPLEERTLPILRCIPEMLVESVTWYLKLVKTYSTQALEKGGSQLMVPILTLLLVMMGSKKRVSNPHLRAKLAQSLECLLPRDQGQLPSLDPNPLGIFHRERLFLNHPHRDQIVPCLLQVFVSIEMTGESVAFEQKFNYRRPMYTVMDYLWKIEDHRNVFKRLAQDAESKMEEVTPPLFLVFLNLLMNDAIYLLDEALSNMAQLRTMITARDAGEWESLPVDERERHEQIFRQTGMVARFDNILGQETIHALEYMSSEIKSIFCHRMLVDRVTSMLNYFLYHLVGPKKKNFKVKDHEDYMFNPRAIVKDICSIYIHLGSSLEFCSAVSRDGRSYSPQLFTLASDVLARIGGGVEMICDLERVSEEVARLAAVQHNDEELLTEAPDEFLDPIMSTIMLDPVTLPSSRVNIDRSTIARHLLSDQTDPFNRSPLTMNMVKPNSELKARIDAWIAEKRRHPSQPSSSS